VTAARHDLDKRDHDIQVMKSQLKTAKKSRKQAAKQLGKASKPTAGKK
jgi:hypothetical protein